VFSYLDAARRQRPPDPLQLHDPLILQPSGVAVPGFGLGGFLYLGLVGAGLCACTPPGSMGGLLPVDVPAREVGERR
jgi:hypothetical protein